MFTKEMIEMARKCKRKEELLTFAKESGMELTEEQAKQLFTEVNTDGELSDDEAENAVAGLDRIRIQPIMIKTFRCPYCRTPYRGYGTVFCTKCEKKVVLEYS